MTEQKNYYFWLFIEQELRDLQPAFAKYFPEHHLEWDCENYWEWLTDGQGTPEIPWLNINRPHQFVEGDGGCYEEPLVVNFTSPTMDTAAVLALAQRVSNGLNTTVFVGTQTYLQGDERSYHIDYELEPEK